MKKFSFVSVLAVTLLLAIGVTSCKPKDADIKKAVETQLTANADAAGVSVAVDGGVVTLTGEVKDETTATAINGAAASVKNVKSVNNNLTVAAPVPTAEDTALQAGLTDALKDHSGVSFAVADGVVTLTGEVSQDDLRIVMQKVSALSPAKIENQLSIK